MNKINRVTFCPICGTSYEVENRVWYYTCPGCGSGINLIGIWLKRKTDQNWLDLDPETKRSMGKKFLQRKHEEIDWSKVVIEI